MKKYRKNKWTCIKFLKKFKKIYKIFKDVALRDLG